MVMLIRHLRSTDKQNSKDDNLSDESLSIKNRTVSFVESNNQDISYVRIINFGLFYCGNIFFFKRYIDDQLRLGNWRYAW